MSFTFDSSAILEASVTMPRIGLWSATVVVDTTVTPGASATLTLPGVTLVGIVRRVGAFRDAMRIELVGAGGLATVLQPKSYRHAPLRLPLTDAVTGGGSRVSASSDASLLTHTLPQWVRVQGAAKAEVASLARAVGASWRALPDGSIWFGRESWAQFTGLYEVLSESPESDRIEIWMERLTLMPGMTLDGRRVSRVEHRITPDRIRTVVLFEE